MKAQITIYASLSFVLVITFICTLISSVKMSVLYPEIDMASRLSIEAVFAGYHNDCLSEFNIFVLDKKQCSDERFQYYIENNINGICSKNSAVLKKAYLTGLKYMTDDNGNPVKEQIIEYMKYAGYKNILDIFEKDKNIVGQAECINDINKSIQECDVSDLSSKNYKTISEYVNEINEKNENIKKLLYDLKEDVSLYDEYKDENYFEAYMNNYDAAVKEMENILKKSDAIILWIDSDMDSDDNIQDKIKNCLEKIKDNKDILGDELSNAMENDLKEETTDSNELKQELDKIKKAVLINKGYIEKIKEELPEVQKSDIDSNPGESVAKIEKCIEISEQVKHISLDNDSYGKSEANKEKLNNIKKLRNKISGGISDIVLNGMDISDGKYEYENLAENYISQKSNDIAAGNFQENLLYDSYLMDVFCSYTGRGEYSSLNYPVEYIICGKNTDRDNLNSIIIKLAAVREAVNMIYLIMDSEKRSEAYALALSVAGFTGNPLIVKAVQYIIMGTWAYGESLLDVRRLLKGEEISIIKNSSDWKLSLENLIAGKIGCDESNVGNSTKAERLIKGKANYNDYLELLLHSLNESVKNYRVMTSMELRMIYIGNYDFRMKNYIYESSAEVLVQPVAGKKIKMAEYKSIIKYTYMN